MRIKVAPYVLRIAGLAPGLVIVFSCSSLRRSDMFIADESIRNRHSGSAMFGTVYISPQRSEAIIKLSTSINISLLGSEDKSLAQRPWFRSSDRD